MVVISGLPAVTVQETSLGRRQQIGSGGMAKVYAIPDFFVPEAAERKLVYKKYRAKARPNGSYGLESLVRLYDGFDPRQREKFDRAFNWPIRVVLDDKAGAAGVLLPLLPDAYFVDLRLTSGARKRKPAEVQFLFQDSAYCAQVGIPYADDDQRRALCRSLVYAMGLLEFAGVVYGDLSARNVLYTLRPRPKVHLVDCDAVRKNSSGSALGAQPHSPDWEPPEAQAARRRRDSTGYAIQSRETDRYKLGLAILRILTPGPVSSVTTDPERARGHLPPHLFTMLRRAVGPDPSARPAPRDWYRELTR